MLISPQNKTATRNKDLAQPARNTRCLPAPDRYRSKKKKTITRKPVTKLPRKTKSASKRQSSLICYFITLIA